jgi:sodium/hydrogen antiporter
MMSAHRGTMGFAAAIFFCDAVSAWLQRADLTARIVFTAETLKSLAEITLVWVLFTDAARVRVQEPSGADLKLLDG